jgi:uncharacterized protein (DUF1810 family)
VGSGSIRGGINEVPEKLGLNGAQQSRDGQACHVQDSGVPDPFDLQRFLTAQAPVYSTALAEIRAGRKQTHWMWFIFPQLAALGRSPSAKHYGLSGLAEAQAYLDHPILGPRLVACVRALMHVHFRTAHEIFGSPDDLKLRSCLTLFSRAAPREPIFGAALARYFRGEPDRLTLELLTA